MRKAGVMLIQRWASNSLKNYYEGSAQIFDWNQNCHISKYVIEKLEPTGYMTSKFDGIDYVGMALVTRLKDAKEAADMDYDKVPKILTDEEKAMRWLNA